MTYELLIEQHRAIFGALGVVGFVNFWLAHRALLRLKEAQPEVLSAAGIVDIDWWVGCIAGVFRLAFRAPGRSLPWRSRILFQGVMFSYTWLAALMVLVVSGVIGIGR